MPPIYPISPNADPIDHMLDGRPVNSGATFVRTSGTSGVGNVLTAVPHTGVIVTGYQWYRNGVAISGATSATYMQVSADLGTNLQVAVSIGSNLSFGRTIPAAAAIAAPTILGIAATGNVLSVTPSGSTYQWQRNTTGTYLDIAGATASTYTVQAGDGVNIRCKVNGVLSNPCSYLGNIGTRCMLPTQKAASTSFNTVRCRTTQLNRDATTGLQLVFGTFYVSDFSSGQTYNEIGAGGTITFTASIEYPAGVFTQAKWSGASSFAQANFTLQPTDVIPVSIPANTPYLIHVHQVAASGNIIFAENTPNLLSPSLLNDAFQVGTGIADLTMVGGEPDGGTQNWFGPCAILSVTSMPSIMLIDDSRGRGEGDTIDATSYLGFARAPSLNFPTMNFGVRGDSVTKYISGTGSAVRRAMIQWCSHIVTDLATNDLLGGRTESQILTDLQTHWGVLAATGRPVFQTTTPPCGVTSSDLFRTTANQTVATNQTARIDNNNVIRGNPSPLAGVLELADVLETARDSGKWINDGTTANKYALDGTHLPQAGYLLVANSGYFRTAAFAR